LTFEIQYDRILDVGRQFFTPEKEVKKLIICLVVFVHIGNAWAMLPDRQAFVFFAVNDGVQTIAIQSNPLLMCDDSGTDLFTLILSEVRDAPAGGGSIVLGFDSSPGSVSSEIYVYATDVIPDSYWNTNATVYGRFELRDWVGAYITDWETPIFLRTIDTITFDYTESGDPFRIDIGGGLPVSPPDYTFTSFKMSPSPKGSLLGINGGTDTDIIIDVNSIDTYADLWVDSPPYDSTTPMWDIEKGPFDLKITTLSLHLADISEAHFNGLDYLGNSSDTDQPTLTLHPEPCGYTLAGDTNSDCKVDLKDFAVLAMNWLINCDTNTPDPACVPVQ